ncbi:hypothetical protein AAL_03195 [Moelleriella libera RCEF 2490]|uniref:Uncharacterized protein n=1 Tax=Moelleriella libera RCEF 2490 TaxID=1081109 RepID=A0A168ED90_9HYPO|nr:hypothetical protein AAL_03195 [Moelleriella libera RCEF 2490]
MGFSSTALPHFRSRTVSASAFTANSITDITKPNIDACAPRDLGHAATASTPAPLILNPITGHKSNQQLRFITIIALTLSSTHNVRVADILPGLKKLLSAIDEAALDTSHAPPAHEPCRPAADNLHSDSIFPQQSMSPNAESEEAPKLPDTPTTVAQPASSSPFLPTADFKPPTSTTSCQAKKFDATHQQLEDLLGPYWQELGRPSREILREKAARLRRPDGTICPLDMANLYLSLSAERNSRWMQVEQGQEALQRMRQEGLNVVHLRQRLEQEEAEAREKEQHRLAMKRRYGLLREA